jgi:chloramphenicol O-acetyltransferase type A
MESFQHREDRFHFFESFENPLLNLTFTLTVPDFLTYCKEHHYPPFHFFLFHLFQALDESDHFKYRLYQNEIIKITQIVPSYTVMNEDNNLNYTRFEATNNLQLFIERSLKAKEIAAATKELINTGVELDEREMKNYVFITSIPWLDFTSIQHPVYQWKSADIPSIAWGKFKQSNDEISMPFSVQAHHGFVDAYHIYQLASLLQKKITATLTK